jgi:hypothetical protein
VPDIRPAGRGHVILDIPPAGFFNSPRVAESAILPRTPSRAGALRYHDEARAAFATIRRQGDYRCQALPTNRELLDLVRIRTFGEGAGRRLQA